MSATKIKTLAIEDHDNDFESLKGALNTIAEDQLEIYHVKTLKEALDSLEVSRYNLILLDLGLPDSQGENTFDRVFEKASFTPIVVFSGHNDSDLAFNLIKKGAQDYLVKGQLPPESIFRVIRYAISRKQIESTLWNTIQRLEATNLNLREAQAQLIQSEKLATLGTLASSMAHEIKNPLAVILQGVELVEDLVKDMDPELQSSVDIIKDSTERASNVINGLLMYSRSTNVNKVPLNVASVIKKSIILTENRAKVNGVSVKFDAGDSSFGVAGDVTMLEQVFFQLLTNAIDAMPDGGKITISGRIDEEEQQAVFEVKDTGEGISEDKISKIFDPFFTTKSQGRGTGLGLSTTKLILEKHNGKITAKSKTGAGTVFFVYLPLIKEN